MRLLPLVLVLLIGLLVLQACERDDRYQGTDGVLIFSEDTLTFDTVFTTIGSVTRSIRIENPLNEDVLIDQIALDGTYGDWFRINVDGIPGDEIDDVLVPADDYIYLFAEIHITGENIPDVNDPFVLQDAIRYRYNGIEQTSYLRAWGQNAYFHYGEIYASGTVTWTSDKPHVIVRNENFIGVGVEDDATLVIDPGCQIYVHPGSGLFVDGRLEALGTAGDTIVFQSDRIEETALDQSTTGGLWFGIGLLSGSEADLRHVTIRQATYGLMVRNFLNGDPADFGNASKPQVTLEACRIAYTSAGALIAGNADLTASNCLFHTTDGSIATLAYGGPYTFEHCTFADDVGSDENAVVALTTFVSIAGRGAFAPITDATFTNCIVHTSFGEGLLFNRQGGSITASFDHCLLSTELDTTTFTDCLIGEDPRFVDPSEGLFRPDSSSVVIDAGTSTTLGTDLLGAARVLGAAPDLGAIEVR